MTELTDFDSSTDTDDTNAADDERRVVVEVDNLAEFSDDVREIGDTLVTHLAQGKVVRDRATGEEFGTDHFCGAAWLVEALDAAGVELQRKSERRDLVREAGDDAVEFSGRPGLGFDVVRGERVPADNHDRVREVLRLVDAGEKSKRWAADELACSRRTIYRALERPALYGLDD